MESPHSEPIETRFSTPVSELDDHRDVDVPRSPAIMARARAETARSGRPGQTSRLEIPGAMRQDGVMTYDAAAYLAESPEIAPKSRDFETAIVDDDRNEDVISPPVRRFTQRVRETLGQNRSRESSSSRSSSPNSIDAFARKERRGTFGSQSELGGIAKTVSDGAKLRRPTFDNASVRLPEGAGVGGRLAEEADWSSTDDVKDEWDKTLIIDYEEIEEFVAMSNPGRSKGSARQRYSFSCEEKLRPILAKKLAALGLPSGEHSNESSDSDKLASLSVANTHSGSVLDEKSGFPAHDRGKAFDGPNRFSFFSSKMPQTIHAPEIGDLIVSGETFRDLFEFPNGNGAWWLDVLNPTEDEMDMLQKAFGIHRLTAEDIEAQEIREKVELFRKYYFVCFRSFSQMDEEAKDYLEPVNLYMVVFQTGILTFAYKQSPHAGDVRKRIGKLRNHINLTADWICYALVDNIVDSFAPVLHKVEAEADAIEDSVYVAREEDLSPVLRRIGDCRKKVMTLMRLLGGKADVIKGFAKRCNESINEKSVAPRGEIGLYLGDIQDHVVTMMSNLGHFEKMLSRTHSNYLAQLSVDNLRQGNRANEVLSKITLIASILVPLNLVCGLFGMNVAVPGGVTDGDLTWFYVIVGGLAGFVVLSLLAAKRFKFI